MLKERCLVVLGSLLLPTLLTAPAAAGEGFWTPLGPSGSFSQDGPVVTHPAAPGTVWVGSYKSTNRGNTWRWAGAAYPGQYYSALAADFSAPGALWAASSTQFLHSMGNGAPWMPTSDASYTAALGRDIPGELVTSKEEPRTVYMKAGWRLLGSFDGGVTWRTVYDDGEDQWVVKAVPGPPGVLYLDTLDPTGTSVARRLVETQDGGLTWTPLPCPAFTSWGCDFQDLVYSRGALFVTRFAGGVALLRSLDGGLTWEAVLDDDAGEPIDAVRLYADPHTGTLWVVTGYPTTLWLSRDNGETWTRRGEAPLLHVVAAGPEAGVVYASTSAGIARSVNGGRTWNEVFPVVRDPDRPPARVSFQPGNPSRMAFVYGHRMFRSDDGGATWRWLTTAPSWLDDVAIDRSNPERMAGVGWTAATTTDGGRKWWPSRSGFFGVELELLVRATSKTLYAGGCGVWRSRDNGRKWSRVLPCSSPRDRRAAQIVQKIAVDPARPNLVFALTFLDRDFYPNHGPMNGLPSNLWRSGDGGRTWKSVALDLDAFDWDAASSRLWMVRGTALSASDDFGATWRPTATVPVDTSLSGITDLAAPRGLPGTLYLVGGPGLLRTRDEGRTWETVADGLPALLAVKPGDPRSVYAMTHEGLFHLRLPE